MNSFLSLMYLGIYLCVKYKHLNKNIFYIFMFYIHKQIIFFICTFIYSQYITMYSKMESWYSGYSGT